MFAKLFQVSSTLARILTMPKPLVIIIVMLCMYVYMYIKLRHTTQSNAFMLLQKELQKLL